MSILILGGNRFMGRHLSAQLAAAGQAPVLFQPQQPCRRRATSKQSLATAPAQMGWPHSRAATSRPSSICLPTRPTGWRAPSAVSDRLLGTTFSCRAAPCTGRVRNVPWTEESPLGPDPAWGSYGREAARGSIARRLCEDRQDCHHRPPALRARTRELRRSPGPSSLRAPRETTDPTARWGPRSEPVRPRSRCRHRHRGVARPE